MHAPTELLDRHPLLRWVVTTAVPLGPRREWLARHGMAVLFAASVTAYAAGGLAYCFVGRGATLFVNDGFQYYSYLPSLVLDRDLDFSNQYALGRAQGWAPALSVFVEPAPRTGRPGNAWSMGPALLWMPFFLVGLAFEALLKPTVNGFSMWCQWSVYLGSLTYGLLAVWLLNRALLARADRLTRWLVLTLLLVGTNLSYYFFFAGHMSHALSFFAVTLHLLCLLRLSQRPHDLRWYALSGLTLGLVFLVRWQDLVLGLLTLTVAARALLQARPPSRAVAGLALGVAGVALAGVVQAWSWQSIYGEPFIVPQGEGWMTWTRPHLAQVLFSYPKGFLVNSPLLILGLAGLLLLWARDRWWAAGSLLVLGAAVYVCAASSQWGAGESFGMRRLVSVLPLLAIGMAELLSAARGWSWRAPLRLGVAVAVLWNWTLLFGYFLDRLRNP